jgi:hypothetical protein
VRTNSCLEIYHGNRFFVFILNRINQQSTPEKAFALKLLRCMLL